MPQPTKNKNVGGPSAKDFTDALAASGCHPAQLAQLLASSRVVVRGLPKNKFKKVLKLRKQNQWREANHKYMEILMSTLKESTPFSHKPDAEKSETPELMSQEDKQKFEEGKSKIIKLLVEIQKTPAIIGYVSCSESSDWSHVAWSTGLNKYIIMLHSLLVK